MTAGGGAGSMSASLGVGRGGVHAVGQTRQGNQQQSRTQVVSHCHPDGKVQQHIGQAQGQLDQQQRAQQGGHAASSGKARPPPQQGTEGAYCYQSQQGTQPVAIVNGHPSLVVEPAAEMAGTRPVKQVEPLGQIHGGQPPALASGQIGTGHGGIVGRGPPSQGNLNKGHQQS